MILHSAKNSYDEILFSRQLFTIQELMDKIKGNEDKPTLLIDYLKERSQAIAFYKWFNCFNRRELSNQKIQ